MQAFFKVRSFDTLKEITDARIKEGDCQRIDGYHFMNEINVSIQGVSANYAWKYALRLAMYLNTPLEISIEWSQSEESAYPGKVGFMEWVPHL